jgi:hypothetical protein
MKHDPVVANRDREPPICAASRTLPEPSQSMQIGAICMRL